MRSVIAGLIVYSCSAASIAQPTWFPVELGEQHFSRGVRDDFSTLNGPELTMPSDALRSSLGPTTFRQYDDRRAVGTFAETIEFECPLARCGLFVFLRPISDLSVSDTIRVEINTDDGVFHGGEEFLIGTAPGGPQGILSSPWTPRSYGNGILLMLTWNPELLRRGVPGVLIEDLQLGTVNRHMRIDFVIGGRTEVDAIGGIFQCIPEPSAAVLLALGGLVATLRRR